MAKREQTTFERLNGKDLNRKQRRELHRQIFSDESGLEILHPDAAGIDIGNESHFVSVPPERDPQNALSSSCATGTGVRLVDGGFGENGRMVDVVWRKDRGDAVHWSLLAFGTRCSGEAGNRGVCGKCPQHQEPAGPQDGRAGKPMVAEIAMRFQLLRQYVRIIA